MMQARESLHRNDPVIGACILSGRTFLFSLIDATSKISAGKAREAAGFQRVGILGRSISSETGPINPEGSSGEFAVYLRMFVLV